MDCLSQTKNPNFNHFKYGFLIPFVENTRYNLSKAKNIKSIRKPKKNCPNKKINNMRA